MNNTLQSIYDVGIKSYDWSINRLDALNMRIDNLITWITIINIAIITIGFNEDIDYNNFSFYISVILYFIIVMGLLLLKSLGRISLLLPRHLFDNMREYDYDLYLKEVADLAGNDFKNNLKLINDKELWSNVAKGLFIVQLTIALVWLM